MKKVTKIRKIGQLIVFSRLAENRTYFIDSDKKARRVEQLVGQLIVNHDCHVKYNQGDYILTITKNIPAA